MPIAWAAVIALIVPIPLILLTEWAAKTVYVLQLLAFILASIGLSRRVDLPHRAAANEARARACGGDAPVPRAGYAEDLIAHRCVDSAAAAERYVEMIADAASTPSHAGGLGHGGRRRSIGRSRTVRPWMASYRRSSSAARCWRSIFRHRPARSIRTSCRTSWWNLTIIRSSRESGDPEPKTLVCDSNFVDSSLSGNQRRVRILTTGRPRRGRPARPRTASGGSFP